MIIKTDEELNALRQGGHILAEILNNLTGQVRPGMSTIELEREARKLLQKHGVEPSFLGYDNYPAALCVSVNDQVVHGKPSERLLQEGDIVSLDLGLWNNGLALDAAVTVGVGKISSEAKKIIAVTKEALRRGLSVIKSGAKTGDFGNAVQVYVESRGLTAVRELVGHGVGKAVHEPPQIPNYGKPETGAVFQENMVVALEPMVTAGSGKVVFDPATLAYKTIDGSIAAHFEVTAVVTKKGVEVLTPILNP